MCALPLKKLDQKSKVKSQKKSKGRGSRLSHGRQNERKREAEKGRGPFVVPLEVRFSDGLIRISEPIRKPKNRRSSTTKHHKHT